MKNLLRTLAIGLIVFGMANCGKKGGGGGEAAPKAGLAGNASQVVINGRQAEGAITWSTTANNIYYGEYVNSSGKTCYYGLVNNADDATLSAAVEELQSLLNQATVQSGTGSEFAMNANSIPTISIQNGDGIQNYYLAAQGDIPSSEKTLSNYDEILEYYNEVLNELVTRNYNYCPGKKDTSQNND